MSKTCSSKTACVFIVLFSSVATNKESSQQEVEKRSFTINKALLADLATSHHTRVHGDYIYAISCRVCTKAVILTSCSVTHDKNKILCENS